MALNEKQKQKLHDVSKVGASFAKEGLHQTSQTVKDLRDPSKDNKGVAKNFVAGFGKGLVNLAKQTYRAYKSNEEMTAYSNCKTDPVCSDATDDSYQAPIYK